MSNNYVIHMNIPGQRYDNYGNKAQDNNQYNIEHGLGNFGIQSPPK